jgi:HIV Tat-specific factor 1
MASTTENEINDFITEGGYDASEGPVTESANDIRDKKRKAKQDEHVGFPNTPPHSTYPLMPFKASKKPKVVQENRAIYVTNLPRDTNENEIEEVFSKYGIIDQGADGNKRIKMYADDEGNFNGEVLIVYFKRASIDLAIRMMDDYFFRIEEQNHGTIRVKEADFSYKRNKDSEQIVSKLTRKDKKASERNRADLNR